MPVTVGDHLVGTVAEVLLDPAHSLALGFELEALSGRRYFLPFALARLAPERVAVTSPLHLVDDVEHYTKRGAIPGPAEDLLLEVVTGRVVGAESPAGLGPVTPR